MICAVILDIFFIFFYEQADDDIDYRKWLSQRSIDAVKCHCGYVVFVLFCFVNRQM